MQLEDSNGRILEPAGVTEVTDMVNRLGKELDHCILSDGDAFIQAAGSDPRLVVEYRDLSGYYRADNPLPVGTVKEFFSAFFQKDDSWKTMAAFSRVDESASGAAKTGESDAYGVNGDREKDLKSGLLDAATRGVKSNLFRLLRRGIRNLFRNFR